MLRALVIGHTYVVSANRGKLRRINENPEIDLTLLCPEAWEEPDFGKKPFEKEEKIKTEVLPAVHIGKARQYRFSSYDLYSTIKKIRPHIIQLEAEASSAIALQLSFLRRFLSFHLVLFAWENIFPESLTHRIAAKITFGSVSSLITGNEDAMSVAKKIGYRKDVTVFPQIGIDLNDYEGSDIIDPWEGRKGVRIGFAGRLAMHKGVETLIEAVQKIPSGLLTIIGDGSQKSALMEKVKDAGLEERVAFVGGIEHELVPPYLNGLNVLVLPSVTTSGWKEQFGHVIIEAMASGVPVIGSDCGAIPDVIKDAGIVFNEKDAEGLVKSICAVAENPDLASQLIEKGIQRVKVCYTNSVLAEKTIEIWQKTVEGK